MGQFLQGDSWFEDYGSLQIDCPRQTFVLPGENQTTADIVEEFAEDHELWARDFLEGWQVIPSSLKFIRPLFPDRQLLFMLSVSSWIPWWCPQVVQQNGNGDKLEDGPKVTWLGYSLLPEGKFCLLPLGFPYSNFIWGVFSKIWFPGTEIKFSLLFTEDLTFDLDPFLFSSDKGLGTMPAENTCVISITDLIVWQE